MDRVIELLMEAHFLLDDYKSNGDSTRILTDTQYEISMALSKLQSYKALDISDDDQ